MSFVNMTLRKNVVLPKNRVSCHEWLFALLVVDHETERFFFLTAGKQKKNEFQPVGAGSAGSAASAGSSALPAAVAGSSPSFDIF